MDLFIQISLLVHIGLLACVYMIVGIFMAAKAIVTYFRYSVLAQPTQAQANSDDNDKPLAQPTPRSGKNNHGHRNYKKGKGGGGW